MLSTTAILKAMFWKSLGEFEKEFTEYFERQREAQEGVAESSTKKGKENGDSFRHFCERINKALSSREEGERAVDKSLRSQAMTSSCRKSCKNVTELRNKLAHNVDIQTKEITGGLEGVRQL